MHWEYKNKLTTSQTRSISQSINLWAKVIQPWSREVLAEAVPSQRMRDIRGIIRKSPIKMHETDSK